MSKDPGESEESVELRHRAEKRLKPRTAEVAAPGSPAEMQRLVHELQVHQIELEMQNEELRESRSQVEAALERYSDLYDFAPVGYFTLSPNGTIREVNLPGARLLGVERANLVGNRFGAFVSETTRPLFDSWLKDVFATGTKRTCTAVFAQAGQPSLTVEIEAALSIDEREARAVVADVSARKAIEEQLWQAQKIEVVGRLAGGVAHDFNNILAAMMLNLDLLQMQHPLPAETLSSLGDMEALARRAASLTRQLLLFSRRHAMHPERLEINAVLGNLLKMLHRLLGEGITCIHLPGTPDLWVEADAGMLDQALMNLCLNAKDAMPSGGTLTLETSLVEFDVESAQRQLEARPGQFVCLRISDTGRGMSPDVLEHLFEPFFTTKEVGQGTGLGLASAYGIIHQHNGWVNVESIVGRGTTLRLYFPLSAKTEVLKKASQILPSNEHETILLVEDETSLLFLSTQALTIFGYRVLSAANSQEALELWEQHWDTINLVLTDMRMPNGVSGLELVKKLRKSKPSLKAIIMSGYNMEMTQTNAVGNERFTFLAKPFDLKTLAETVRQCLD